MLSYRDEQIKKLAIEIQNCKLCELHLTRLNPVIGEGNINTSLVLIGEAPGKKEDENGIPFVGSAGKLLNKMLEQTGFKRIDFYITNVVKCRPPNNRRPSSHELKNCIQHLEKQLQIIKPKIVVPLGNIASRLLMDFFELEKANIGSIHGKKFSVEASWGTMNIFPLYHPAGLLYNRRLEKLMVEDLKTLKKSIESMIRV